MKVRTLVAQSVQFYTALWTVARWFLCPWKSLGKKTGVGCHSLLQMVFLTQVSCIAGRFFTIWATSKVTIGTDCCYNNFIPRKKPDCFNLSTTSDHHLPYSSRILYNFLLTSSIFPITLFFIQAIVFIILNTYVFNSLFLKLLSLLPLMTFIF